MQRFSDAVVIDHVHYFFVRHFGGEKHVGTVFACNPVFEQADAFFPRKPQVGVRFGIDYSLVVNIEYGRGYQTAEIGGDVFAGFVVCVVVAEFVGFGHGHRLVEREVWLETLQYAVLFVFYRGVVFVNGEVERSRKESVSPRFSFFEIVSELPLARNEHYRKRNGGNEEYGLPDIAYVYFYLFFEHGLLLFVGFGLIYAGGGFDLFYFFEVVAYFRDALYGVDG